MGDQFLCADPEEHIAVRTFQVAFLRMKIKPAKYIYNFPTLQEHLYNYAAEGRSGAQCFAHSLKLWF